MGEIVRSWPFEVDSVSKFELVIKEPAITGGSLGLKTWGSSYLLALHLQRIASTSLFPLFDESLGEPKPRILELGSGTGLLGLAAASIWKTHVVLSDLPDIVPNLRENVVANSKMLQTLGGSAEAGVLTWGGDEDESDQDLFGVPNQFKVSFSPCPMPHHLRTLPPCLFEHRRLTTS